MVLKSLILELLDLCHEHVEPERTAAKRAFWPKIVQVLEPAASKTCGSQVERTKRRLYCSLARFTCSEAAKTRE
jgi:hypothetical protein